MFGSFEYNPKKPMNGVEPGMKEVGNELNEKVQSGEASFLVPEKSQEEQDLQNELGDRFENLNSKYFELKSLIKEKEEVIKELKMRKNSLSQRSQRLSLKQLDWGVDQTTVDMMTTAEDRMDMLARKIKNKEIDLDAANEELETILKRLNMIAGMIPLNEERLEITDKKPFDPSQN